MNKNIVKSNYVHLNKEGEIVEAVVEGIKMTAEEYMKHKAAQKAAYLENANKYKMLVACSPGNKMASKMLEWTKETNVKPEIFINDGRSTQILYYWAKEQGAKILYRPANWKKDGKGAGFINNEKLVQEAVREHWKVFIFWDGQDRITKDLYMRVLRERLPYELILLNEEDELVRCDDFLDGLYKMRNELDQGEDPDGELLGAIMSAINSLRGGWEKPSFLKELERSLMQYGLFLDIGFNTGWSIDDEEAGGHLVEETEYDGFGFDEVYV